MFVVVVDHVEAGCTVQHEIRVFEWDVHVVDLGSAQSARTILFQTLAMENKPKAILGAGQSKAYVVKNE